MTEPTPETEEDVLDDLSEGSPEEATLPSELKFYPNLTLRSRGTVQHGTYEWERHNKAYSEQHYTLAVAAYKRWQRNVGPVPYAVVVRLEDLARNTEIYSEVQSQIEVEAEV